MIESHYARYRRKLLAEWEAVSGPEAARMRWVSVRFQLSSLLSAAVGTAAGIIAAYSHGSARAVLIWFGIVLYSTAVLGIMAMLYAFRKWKKAARRWRAEAMARSGVGNPVS